MPVSNTSAKKLFGDAVPHHTGRMFGNGCVRCVHVRVHAVAVN